MLSGAFRPVSMCLSRSRLLHDAAAEEMAAMQYTKLLDEHELTVFSATNIHWRGPSRLPVVQSFSNRKYRMLRNVSGYGFGPICSKVNRVPRIACSASFWRPVISKRFKKNKV